MSRCADDCERETFLASSRRSSPALRIPPLFMTAPIRFRLAALCGFAAVALGAFGAHGMKAILAQHGTAAAWETAVLYHLSHAVVLLVISGREPGSPRAWALFATGILIFSGTLYLLAATNIRWLGAIT